MKHNKTIWCSKKETNTWTYNKQSILDYAIKQTVVQAYPFSLLSLQLPDPFLEGINNYDRFYLQHRHMNHAIIGEPIVWFYVESFIRRFMTI